MVDGKEVWVTTDPNKHWKECTRCGAVKDAEEHIKECTASVENPEESHASICLICGWTSIKEKHQYDYEATDKDGNEYKEKDSKYHIKEFVLCKYRVLYKDEEVHEDEGWPNTKSLVHRSTVLAFNWSILNEDL